MTRTAFDPSFPRHAARARDVLWFCLALSACGPAGGAYCQSGPKYGTQCYAAHELDPPGSAPRKDADDRH